MNIEDFRTYCLSFKGVSEKMPFGKASTEYDRNLLVFSVCDKWFCFVNVDVFDFCNVKCRPEQSEELQERYEGMRPGSHEQTTLAQHLLQQGCTGLADTLARQAVIRPGGCLAYPEATGSIGKAVRCLSGNHIASKSALMPFTNSHFPVFS